MAHIFHISLYIGFRLILPNLENLEYLLFFWFLSLYVISQQLRDIISTAGLRKGGRRRLLVPPRPSLGLCWSTESSFNSIYRYPSTGVSSPAGDNHLQKRSGPPEIINKAGKAFASPESWSARTRSGKCGKFFGEKTQPLLNMDDAMVKVNMIVDKNVTLEQP